MSSSELSDYEKLRLANIARNNMVIDQLNIRPIKQQKPKVKAAAKKAKKTAPAEPTRASTRKRAAVAYFVPGGDFGEDDSDYDSADDGSDSDSDDDNDEGKRKRSSKKAWTDDSIPLPKRSRKFSTAAPPPPTSSTMDSVTAAASAEAIVADVKQGTSYGGITCEMAKTG